MLKKTLLVLKLLLFAATTQTIEIKSLEFGLNQSILEEEFEYMDKQQLKSQTVLTKNGITAREEASVWFNLGLSAMMMDSVISFLVFKFYLKSQSEEKDGQVIITFDKPSTCANWIMNIVTGSACLFRLYCFYKSYKADQKDKKHKKLVQKIKKAFRLQGFTATNPAQSPAH